MKKSIIIGVMGGGQAMPEDIDAAYCLGSLIAKQGWVLLNGGRNAGIMDASAKGAAEHNGLTIGILPDDNCSKISSHIQIPIVTVRLITRHLQERRHFVARPAPSHESVPHTLLLHVPEEQGQYLKWPLLLKTTNRLSCLILILERLLIDI